MTAEHDANLADPCAITEPAQHWAFVWFISAIIIGSVLTWRLATWDRWMYDHNGEFLDYRAYRENRDATYGIRSEVDDSRAHADLESTVGRLE